MNNVVFSSSSSLQNGQPGVTNSGSVSYSGASESPLGAVSENQTSTVTKTTSASTTNANTANVAAASPETLVQQLNHKLYPQGLEAVFQFDNQSHTAWINVVNKETGQVVQKWPPESIRQMIHQADSPVSKASTNLSFDAYA